MNVSLTPELERFVSGQVASGLYTSASEVMRQALRLLVERERAQQAKLAALRGAVAEGLEQGGFEPFEMNAFLTELDTSS